LSVWQVQQVLAPQEQVLALAWELEQQQALEPQEQVLELELAWELQLLLALEPLLALELGQQQQQLL
jgi:hypothetical protein